MRTQSRILVLVALIGWLPLQGSIYGQESGGNDQKAASSDQDKDGIREQTIYIPYDKLKRVFEKEGRGVFLPYEKFQQLWQAAQKQTQKAEPSKRPVDAVIHQIDSEATIGDQVVEVTATLKLEILGEGWVSIPLRLRNSAIRQAKLADQPARIVADKAVGYRLLYHNDEDQPKQVELKLQYARKYDKTPGQSSVAFEAPQAPINRWTIHVPEAGMAVEVQPMIAATRVPEKDGEANEGKADLLAFVGAAPSVRISWNPKAEGASGLAAFATVKTEQQMTVSEGVVRSAIKLEYDISRSTLTQLVLEVPADQKVVNVYDGNVKRWKPETSGDKQQLQVDLFEATRGKQALTLELEKFSDATESSYEVSVPLVRAVGVGRQQGIVVVRLDAGLQGEAVKRAGLMQLDQNDLPPALKKSKWGFSYRYGAVPYELRLRVEKVLPRISATELIDAELSSNELLLTWQGLFLIEEASVFQLQVDLPDGFEVRSIHGQSIPGSQPAAVDSYHRVADDSSTWRVNLSKKALGKVGLVVQLRRRLDDPNLLSPTGKSSTIPIPLPHATPSDLEFSQGSIVVSAPESLRVNPTETTGLRSTSFAEARKAIPTPPASSKQLHPTLSYAFAKGETKLSVTAERRRPQVTVRQLLQAEIAAGVIKYQASFFFDIKYSGVKSLRIDVPTALVADIRNATKAIRQDDLTPAPDDVADGYTAWSFASESEMLGATQIRLEWEKKLEELSIGSSRQIDIPRLAPMSVDRATGQIVISKSESLDVQPVGEPSGLIPIDPQNDLMPQAKVEGAAMAFEFVGDWSLNIKATRYELETSKLTSIERGLVRIVALSQGELSVQALYRMRSARQRLAIQLPKDATFDAQPLRIDGKAVTPERDSVTTIYAPLVDQDIDQTFLLELRYSVKGTPARLDLPSFPDDPAVQKVFLCAYLPVKTVLLASDGPWSDEQSNRHLDFGTGGASTSADEQRLINWVSEGLSSGANAARTFPIGKSQLYVYSTLRPEDAPVGSLRLTTMDRKVFNGAIILLVALLGLPLYKRSLRLQISLLLFITGVLLVVGVFIPELARSILGGVFPIAIAVIAVIWLIGHVSKLRVAWRRPAPPTPTPTEEGEAESPFSGEAGGDEDAEAESPAAEAESPPGESESSQAGDEPAGDEGGQDHA